MTNDDDLFSSQQQQQKKNIEDNSEDLGVLKLQLQETFDMRLNYKLRVKYNDERAVRNYELHRKYLSTSKIPVILFYMLIIPAIEVPYWCMAKAK